MEELLPPQTKKPAEDDDFADVGGVVVDDQKQFAEEGVAGGVGEFGGERVLRVLGERDGGVEVGEEGGAGLLPLGLRAVAVGPVLVGPLEFLVVREIGRASCRERVFVGV